MTDNDDTEQNPLLELFRADLKSQLDAIANNLNLLQTGSGAEIQEALANLISMAHSTKSGANIVQMDAIADLSGALESFFMALQKKAITATAQQNALIIDAVNILKEIAEADPSQWPGLLDEQAERFKVVKEGLQGKSGAEPVPERKPPPADIVQPVRPQAGVEGELTIDTTMFDLFQTEVDAQTAALNQGLVDLERAEKTAETLQSLMRAAHSIKGAARVLGLDPIVNLAHAIEDCFVAAQQNKVTLLPEHIDIIFRSIDMLSKVKDIPQARLRSWLDEEHGAIQGLVIELHGKILGQKIVEAPSAPPPPPPPQIPAAKPPGKAPQQKEEKAQDRVLRVTAQNLNRLMGLAGESLVESRWLQPFSYSLLKVKKGIQELSRFQDHLREILEGKGYDERLEHYLVALQHKINECNQSITDRLAELDMFILRHSSLSDRLYREVIDSRMRPFADGVEAFPRMVRDLARQLNKKVHLEIIGKMTPVDRDILDKLEAPLSHLIRNAVDHGIESPEERERNGKKPEGTIKLEAMHRAGMLSITVSDDGRGIDMNQLRKDIVEKNLIRANMAASLTEMELMDFLFLPGFSTAANVSEISGRGVGLNVVQNMIQEVAGTVRSSNVQGKGMSFQLMLPLTLSVIRALIVEISGETYAFPLARIDRSLSLPKEKIDIIENRQYFKFEGQNIGLVHAAQVLDLEEKKIKSDLMPVVVISDHLNCYGIVVDNFLSERELVVHELDPRLGKVPDINAGALMEDGTPVLIVDVEDLVRSIDVILSGGRLHKLGYADERTGARKKKSILVIDDSITVREVECRLLQNKGYEVQSAVNGIDGWNALRMGNFDLVVTDVDMPRMNGIELVRMIRSDPKLKKLPVMIVSYKEREEDRMLGLEAGANYYLTKSSFHDETLINAVFDLIGKPESEL